MDKKATEQLAVAIENLMSSGAFDRLKNDTEFHALSMSRMGYFGDRKVAEALFSRFKARGLAKQSEDGVSIPLHPAVRYSILVLLAHILKPQGAARGLDLSPATDQIELVEGLTTLLNVPSTPSAGKVVEFDLQAVAVDLARVPLDEVLDFRAEHITEHRKYVNSARTFARDLSLMSKAERRKAFQGRQDELDEIASDLRRKARSAWKRPASFGLGLAGAAWRLHAGDPVGALLSAAGSVLGLGAASTNETGAYSYLFTAQHRFHY